MNKPYITGKVNDIPFVVDEKFQVECEDADSKKLLQKLVRKGLATFDERKSWSKWDPQFYVEEEFKKNPSIKVKRVFAYENDAVIEYVRDQYYQSDVKRIYLEATFLLIPFTMYTDFSVVRNDGRKDGAFKPAVKSWFDFFYAKCSSPSVPCVYGEMCYWIIENGERYFTKIKHAYIYKVPPSPKGVVY